MSCRQLGRPDCDGWLLLRKVPGGFMGPRWRRCWFVLKGHTLYWYRQPQVRSYSHTQVSESPWGPGSCPSSTIHSHLWAPDPLGPSIPICKTGHSSERELRWCVCKSSLERVSQAAENHSDSACRSFPFCSSVHLSDGPFEQLFSLSYHPGVYCAPSSGLGTRTQRRIGVPVTQAGGGEG